MKKVVILLFVFFSATLILFKLNNHSQRKIYQNQDGREYSEKFISRLVEEVNNKDITVTVEKASLQNYDYDFYMGKNLSLMVEKDFLIDILSCSVMEYKDSSVVVSKGENTLELKISSSDVSLNETVTFDLGDEVVKTLEGKIYIPMNNIFKYINFDYEYFLIFNAVNLIKKSEEKLPEFYDMRQHGRVTPVRDQGKYGTCWAFASLGALETTLMPMDNRIFSTEHMALNNSYGLDMNEGGEHTMSIAYLAAWQGPVLEQDDPYGDGISDNKLKAIAHLEEAILVDGKDLDVLKSAIFRYGALETSIYSQMLYIDSYSSYFSEENSSYYYQGDNISNHDVVVVGWDDNFPKENFTNEPPEDGAFICKNSWGEEFGEDGYFYISYFDSNICKKSVVYTKVGSSSNYDKIYQSDLLGWIGQLGFGQEKAYFANVYKSGSNEELGAVSFYATGPKTKFNVYVVEEFKDENSLSKNRKLVVSGETKYAGYYTAKIEEPIKLLDNKKFAVIVEITTPNAVHPIAIEYMADQRSKKFDISDGEGYISLYGEFWHSAEKTQDCNVCLKAFTKSIDSKD